MFPKIPWWKLIISELRARSLQCAAGAIWSSLSGTGVNEEGHKGSCPAIMRRVVWRKIRGPKTPPSTVARRSQNQNPAIRIQRYNAKKLTEFTQV